MRKNQGIFERFRVPKKVKGNSFTFSEVLPYESSFDLQPYDSWCYTKCPCTFVHDTYDYTYAIRMFEHVWENYPSTLTPLPTSQSEWQLGWLILNSGESGWWSLTTVLHQFPRKSHLKPPVSIQTSKVCKCKSSEASFGFPQAILNTWCRYMPWTWITAKAVCFDEAKTLWCQGAGGDVVLGWVGYESIMSTWIPVFWYYIFCCCNELSTSFYSTQLTTGVYLMLLFLASIAQHLPSGNWTQSWSTWVSRKKRVQISRNKSERCICFCRSCMSKCGSQKWAPIYLM